MGSTKDTDNPFVEWLLGQLQRRKWTQADLAREIGAQQSVINNVVNRKVALGVDLARRIADALDVKQTTLFKIARLIDDEAIEDAKEDEAAQRLQKILSSLDPDERESAVRFLEFYVRDHTRKATATSRPARRQT